MRIRRPSAPVTKRAGDQTRRCATYSSMLSISPVSVPRVGCTNLKLLIESWRVTSARCHSTGHAQPQPHRRRKKRAVRISAAQLSRFCFGVPRTSSEKRAMLRTSLARSRASVRTSRVQLVESWRANFFDLTHSRAGAAQYGCLKSTSF